MTDRDPNDPLDNYLWDQFVESQFNGLYQLGAGVDSQEELQNDWFYQKFKGDHQKVCF